MELVSQCSTSANQVVQVMHPQGSSTSLSQQSHMPQSLSNIHTNPSAAHNFSSQHPFALTVSSMNQNSDQAPTSNHPIRNPAAGQSYNLQKSNNATPVQNSQTHSQPSVQPVANVAPQIEEQPPPEKSQANGTSEGEPSQKSFALSGFSVASKDKPSGQKPTPSQGMEVDPPSVQENIVQISALPVPAKTDNTESVTSKSTPEVSSAKSTEEVATPKEAHSPPSSSVAVLQPETDKPIALSTTASEKEQDPLHIPENENLETAHQVNKSESKTGTVKQEEFKVENDLQNNDGTLIIDAIKSTPSADVPIKEECSVKKEIPDVKIVSPVKTTPRKTKTTFSQERERTPVGPSSTAASSSIGKVKRQRIRTQHYQSPLPEMEFVSKISSTSLKNNDEKLIVFYKNEFLAVRNAEGGFYLCQAVQNIYKSSPKIKIRWLSQDKNVEQGEVYTPDFYDSIDFDCILTNLSLNKADKGKFVLPPSEKSRTESILNRSLAVEKGEEITSPSLTEEHPDGLDLSLYRDEDQLKKRKGRKRSRKTLPTSTLKETPTKKSPKVAKARKVSPPVKETVKKVAPKKSAKATKKTVTPVEPKPVISAPKSSKLSGKVNSKTSTKTSPVVDQKKAKVLARIGRKAAVAAVTKSAKNNSKNEKPGIKAVSTSNKSVQPKANSNGSVKTTTRSVRKSARK